jgi:SAM-dependent methyltransferase
MNKREDVWDYWYNPPAENGPERYILGNRPNKRSKFLLELFQKHHVFHTDTILELGCNVGRNLLALRREGYERLYGIEINPDAVGLMQNEYPEIGAKIRVGTIEEQLPTHRTVHVIFTVAVLMHIHPNSEWVFAKMAERTRKLIVTIEDEKSKSSSLHTSRNYRKIFQSYGMKCIDTVYHVPGANGHYVARVFLKIPNKNRIENEMPALR